MVFLLGKTDTSLHEKDEHPVPSTPQENFQQLPVKEIGHSKASDNMTTVQIELGQMLQPSRKMKLQLFPIDEGTRIGLEKDGHNPYLELTLSSRKKVGSVLKHLHNKWDTSTVAMGELVLFPYNVRLENLAGYRRWTVKDGDTSSADVYEAIGRPAIFRLRYGWFSDLESKTLQTPFTSSDVLQSEDVQKHCSGIIGTMNRHKQPSEVSGLDQKPCPVRNPLKSTK
ncbi:PREDICTED: TSL-kinase interacting protein 1-like [Nelumbo nucifera]|uniref:TSL-kinase interacting protein 1-like n=1 Tax=Nelumbo nucifera TaxID=4432 RepID=A0A1U8Q7V0_NELNU|nr:PREDICTED: TSL-kinase interacting protein 1-like [Nelumbo nucifera]